MEGLEQRQDNERQRLRVDPLKPMDQWVIGPFGPNFLLGRTYVSSY